MNARLLRGSIVAAVALGALVFFILGPSGLLDEPAPEGTARPEAPASGVNAADGAGPRDAPAGITTESTAHADDEEGVRSEVPAPAPTAVATPQDEARGADEGSVRGRIVDDATGAPLAGVEARLEDSRGTPAGATGARSTADGGFLITRAPAGAWLVRAVPDAADRVARRRSVDVAAGATTDAGTIRVSRGLRLSGRAVDARNGAPLAGATVRAYQPEFVDAGDQGRHGTTAGADGAFAFPDAFGPGEILLSAETQGFRTLPPFPSVVAAGHDLVDVTVTAAPALELRGTVLDQDGRGARGRVELRAQGRRVCCVETDARGSFVIDDVAFRLGLRGATSATEVQLWVRGDAFRPASRTLTLGQLERREALEIRVDPGASVRGRAFDLSGTPLADVRVRCVPAGLERRAYLRETRTDATGAFSIQGLDDGDQAIEPEPVHDGLVPVLRRQIVHSEHAAPAENVELAYTRGLSIAGSARTDEERPLAGRVVTLHHPEWIDPLVTYTDDAGAFRFAAVPDGSYTLALRGRNLRERREPAVLRDVPAGTEDAHFVVHEEPRDGRIELTLRDAQDGSFLRGDALLRLQYVAHGFAQDESRKARIDERGRVVLEELERAEYVIDAGAAGFAPRRITCALTRETPESRLEVLLPHAITLFGVVTDGAGAPVADARVQAFVDPPRAAFAGDRGATSDFGGRFTLDDAAPDATVIIAVAPGYAPGSAAVDLGLAASGGLRVVLQRGARIEGLASFADGAPARGVALRLEGALALHEASVDADGRFAFTDVEDGSFLLTLEDGTGLGDGTIVDGAGLVVDVTVPGLDDV